MILLDTHVWLWWLSGHERLSKQTIDALDAMPSKSIKISAISFWEIALLAQSGRLELPEPPDRWLKIVSADPRIEVLSISAEVATQSAMLPKIHKDPADRIPIAHSIVEGHTLASEDSQIHDYGLPNVIRPSALTLAN